MNLRLQWLITLLNWLMWLMTDLDKCPCGRDTLPIHYHADGRKFAAHWCMDCNRVFVVQGGRRINIKRWGRTA